jgi:diacylglycerol O-acyltransferase
MRRLNAQDDRWLCLESPTAHFQMGALLMFEPGPGGGAEAFFDAVRSHLDERVRSSPMLVVHRPAPFEFDAGCWRRVDRYDVDHHIRPFQSGPPVTRDQLHAFVAEAVMEPFDLTLPPFRFVVFDRLADGSLAVVFQVHHSLADGIGFQTLVSELTDPAPVPQPTERPAGSEERAPVAPWWLARSAARFGREAIARRRQRADREAAQQELAALRTRPGGRRARTPDRGPLSGPNSVRRAFDTLTLPRDVVREAGTALGGSVNDVVLAACGGALRRYLDRTGLLDHVGEAPLVAMVPRSQRRPEHGDLRNHLGLLLPSIATNVADPRQRVAAVRASMRTEIERAELQERITSDDDRPFGARQRRRLRERGTIAGNLSISNVPGPTEPRYLAGYRLRANYPMPTLPETQFVNITLRRYCDNLDFGIMVDADKVDDVSTITDALRAAVDELVEAASSR